MLRTLAHFNVTGHRVTGAPGIYVRLDDPGSHALLPQRPMKQVPKTIGVRTELPDGDNSNLTPINTAAGSDPDFPDFTGLGKIAALGVKVSRHCTYHGLALNVAMDLEPYSRINPCGYAGLRSVDLSTIGISVDWQEAADLLSRKLQTYLAP